MRSLRQNLMPRARGIDSAGAIVGIGFIVILLACYIVSGIWLYRASANAAAVHPADGRITPGWAVGWYFVPFANLWMPFKSMRQTWNGLNGNPDMNKGMPGWTIAWWVLWLIGNYVAWFGLRLNLDAQTLDEFRLATTFDIVSSVASIPAALLFRKLILDLTRASAGATPFTPSEMPGASPEEG